MIDKTVIDILGIEYTIYLVDNLPLGLLGTVEHRDCVIKIAKDLSPSRLRETLLHEILHAVEFTTINVDLEEKIINALSAGLFSTLKNNPHLPAILFAPTDYMPSEGTVHKMSVE